MKVLLATLALGCALVTAAAAQDLRMIETSRVGPWRIMAMAANPGQCSARIDGKDIDLIVMLNNADKLVLMAGHPTWKLMQGGDVASTIAIDNGKAKSMKGMGVMTSVTTMLDDEQANAALRGKTLDWSLPQGDFKIGIDRMGDAVAALRACKADAAKG